MWDWLGKISGAFKNNADTFQGLGAIVSGVGSAIAAHKQAKAAQKNYKLNLDILREEKERRKKAQQSLEQGWLGAMRASKRKDEEE